jgi:hypothetical protein
MWAEGRERTLILDMRLLEPWKTVGHARLIRYKRALHVSLSRHSKILKTLISGGGDVGARPWVERGILSCRDQLLP